MTKTEKQKSLSEWYTPKASTDATSDALLFVIILLRSSRDKPNLRMGVELIAKYAEPVIVKSALDGSASANCSYDLTQMEYARNRLIEIASKSDVDKLKRILDYVDPTKLRMQTKSDNNSSSVNGTSDSVNAFFPFPY